MIHKWKTQQEGRKIKLSQSSTKQSQKMRWKIREKIKLEDRPGGPTSAQEEFQGEENKVEKKQRMDSRKSPRTEGISFQTGSHMFFRWIRMKTEPPLQHIITKFQSDKGHTQGLNNLHPLPPSQGATKGQSTAKQEKHKKRREIQEPLCDPSVTHHRTKAKGIPRTMMADLRKLLSFRS